MAIDQNQWKVTDPKMLAVSLSTGAVWTAEHVLAFLIPTEPSACIKVKQGYKSMTLYWNKTEALTLRLKKKYWRWKLDFKWISAQSPKQQGELILH